VKKQTAEPPIIETSPIRLSVDETRILLRVLVAGKPVKGDHYNYSGLAEMGILERTEIPEEKETAEKIAECWKEAREGLKMRDVDIVHQAMHTIERLNSDRHREQSSYLYSLSEFGKQVARGISVRLNGQAAGRVAGR
jgi:hypothetical protein